MQFRLAAAVTGLILLVLFTFAWRPPQADPQIAAAADPLDDTVPELILAPPPEDLQTPGSIRRTDRLVQPATGSTLSPKVEIPPPVLPAPVPQAGSTVKPKSRPKPVRVPVVPPPRPVEAGSVVRRPAAAVPVAPPVHGAPEVILGRGRGLVMPPTVVLAKGMGVREATPTLATGTTLARMIAIGQDGLQIAVGDSDGEIRLIDVPSNTVTRTINLTSGALLELLYTPDGALLTSATGNQLNLYDTASGEIVRRYQPGPTFEAMTLLPGGEHLIAKTHTGRVIRFSLTTGDHLDLGPQESGSAIAVSSDGRYVAAGTMTGIIRLWALDSPDSPYLIEAAGNVRGLAFSPDNRRLAGVASDGRIRLWTIDPPRELKLERFVAALPQPNGIQFGRDPGQLFVSSQVFNSYVTRVELRSAAISEVIGRNSPPAGRDFAISSDGLTLAALFRDRTIHVITLDPNSSTVKKQVTITAARTP